MSLRNRVLDRTEADGPEAAHLRAETKGRVVGLQPKRARGKLLFAGGVLGLVGTGFILAAPELGLAAAIGGTLIASLGSAGFTLLARR